MSDLAKRSGGPPSRRTREQRAYRLVVAAGTSGAIAVVGLVLAVLGVIGYTIPLLAVVVALVCWLLFRRATSPSS